MSSLHPGPRRSVWLALLALTLVVVAYGGGLATFSEDGAKHHRMTLIGRIEG
jgi:hypothetical protein